MAEYTKEGIAAFPSATGAAEELLGTVGTLEMFRGIGAQAQASGMQDMGAPTANLAAALGGVQIPKDIQLG